MFFSVSDRTDDCWSTNFNLKDLKTAKRLLISFKNAILCDDTIKEENSFAIKEIEEFVKKTGVTVNYRYSHRFETMYKFYYEPLMFIPKKWNFEIFLPAPSLFQGSEFIKQKYYYYGLFHELTHWTGIKQNLNRETLLSKDKFYHAQEEIIAGFGSLILLDKFGLVDSEMNARGIDYIDSHSQSMVYYGQKHGLFNSYDIDKNTEVAGIMLRDLHAKAEKACRFLESF